MTSLYTLLDGAVNVYTMDHRGTGRSNLLDCVASQATTSGSPGGSSITMSEVPNCAQELETKYGSDLSSFSITSAATDMATFIATFLAGKETYVYGVSYGTSVVERLIHLAPEEVVGYILDGVSTSSGSDVSKFEYFSTWDQDYGEVGNAYLDLCAKDSTCSKHFSSTDLPTTVKNLISTIDTSSTSCATLISSASYEDYPSYLLRTLFASLLASATTRPFIPVLAYRIDRCNTDDLNVLYRFLDSWGTLSSSSQDDLYESNLLYYLIVFSELWETPEVSYDDMVKRFTDTTMSSESFYMVDTYCAFSKENSTTCAERDLDLSTFTASPIVYKKDKYWNTAAKIPSQASVLLMNGKLDPQTPYKYATYLLDALDGDNKELITFDYATHGTLWTTPLETGSTCGMDILASYVKNGGDLSLMDKSCIAEANTISFEIQSRYSAYFLGTTDQFDGAYDESLTGSLAGSSSSGSGSESANTSSSGGSTKYKAAFIVFIILFVLAAIVAVFFGIRYARTKRSQRNAAEMVGPVTMGTPTPVGAYQTGP